MPPFDSLGMVSYSTSIATMDVSRTVSEIHRLIGQKSPNSASPLGVKCCGHRSYDLQCHEYIFLG